MEYTKIKNSDLTVSRFAMGGCPMGEYGWGKVDEKDLIDAVHTALDEGVTLFDTADTYGLGKSEQVLGGALGEHRKDVVINTKFGVRVGKGGTTYDNSPSYIKEACEKSLKNLGTDYIDIYTVHYRDGKTPISEVLGALEELKKEGKIRYFGLSNITDEDIPELKEHKGSFVMFQDEYSLAQRKNERYMFELAEELQLTPLTWGSLGQGILSGKYDRNTTFGPDDRRSRPTYVNFHGEKLLKNLEIVDAMRPIAQAHGKSIAAVAIRFILDWIPDSVVLAGVKRPGQLTSNIESMDWNLSKEELDMLNRISWGALRCIRFIALEDSNVRAFSERRAA